MESGIQITGIEVPGQVERWWVMDNGVEGFVREGRCQVTAVTNQLLDPGIGEQFLRPGIGPANLNDDGIKFDGDHLFGGLGCQDCGITQAGGCIQYQAISLPSAFNFWRVSSMGLVPLMRCIGMPEISMVGAASVGIRL